MSIVKTKSRDLKKANDPWTPLIYKVRDKFQENKWNATFILEPSSDKSISPIQPGQFNMLYSFGKGEIPISVSSLDWEEPLLCHTIQGVGAISNSCYKLKVGDKIGVRGPFGSVWPIEKALGKDVLILAGGVGIAPLRPLIEKIAGERHKYKTVNVLYGSRDPHSLLFHTDIISWQSDPSINFQVTVDQCQKRWKGNVGVVTSLLNLASFLPEDTVAFLCGPEVMMRFGIYALLDTGIIPSNIYLSMERNMKCAIGQCGHCQWGSNFVCKDGPVFNYEKVKKELSIKEL